MKAPNLQNAFVKHNCLDPFPWLANVSCFLYRHGEFHSTLSANHYNLSFSTDLVTGPQRQYVVHHQNKVRIIPAGLSTIPLNSFRETTPQVVREKEHSDQCIWSEVEVEEISVSDLLEECHGTSATLGDRIYVRVSWDKFDLFCQCTRIGFSSDEFLHEKFPNGYIHLQSEEIIIPHNNLLHIAIAHCVITPDNGTAAVIFNALGISSYLQGKDGRANLPWYKKLVDTIIGRFFRVETFDLPIRVDAECKTYRYL